MENKYDLNDLALMTGFTTRTLRNYLTQGLLEGEKENGVWQFTPEQLDHFFSEPFVKEGLRIKRSSAVFDFLAEKDRKTARTCVVLDLPASRQRETPFPPSSAGRCRRPRTCASATAGTRALPG